MELNTVFEKVWGMGAAACIAIFFVLAARLLLKKAPKIISYALWGVVLIRLLCPVSVESVLSLIPQPVTEVAAPSVSLIVPTAAQQLSGVPDWIGQMPETAVTDPVSNAVSVAQAADPALLKGWKLSVEVIWLCGAAALALVSLVRYFRLRKTLAVSVPVEGNVYLADRIPTPFVLGLLHPKIYLPSSVTEGEWSYILAHERHHIRRGDHIIKLLAFTALCIHWFNPLVWLAFYLAGQDMEMSCDEAVIRALGENIRGDYSQSLLNLSTGRRVAFLPLAFGEGDPKGRIRNLGKWKKPATWVAAVAAVLCAVLAVCLLTDPKTGSKEFGDQAIQWVDTSEYGWYYGGELPCETELEQFPGTKFYYDYGSVWSEKNGEITELFIGMPVWNVFLMDLTEDGAPEFCATVSFGSGLVDDHIVVFDYVNMREYTLWERGEYDYCLQLVNGDLVVVKSEYGSGERVSTGSLALTASGGAAEYTLELVEQDAHQITMVPTDSEMIGPYDDCLFVQIDGKTYRYRRESFDPEGLTVADLLDTYVEKGVTESYYWEVYTTLEYPDKTVLLACVGGADQWISYRYAPSEAVEDGELEKVSNAGYVVMENGDVTSGQASWLEFVKKTQEGEAAVIYTASYYTLDPKNCSEEYYQTHAEDYPCLYLHELSFDGEKYTLFWVEYGQTYIREYKYLMHYSGDAESASASYDAYDKYVLTNDNTVTWMEILSGTFSSQLGAYIDHYTVYNDYIR